MKFPHLTPGQRFALPCPRPGADSLWLAQWVAQRASPASTPSCVAIVCADAQDAQRLLDEMAFFAPQLRCALFPDWETLPYDVFSPHQDLISERLATLWRIQQGEVDVVLVPATTALYRLAPPSFLAAYTFSFQVQQQLREQDLKDQLTLAGYQHVGQVMSPGEYTIRGGLIDLFPMGSNLPFRIDLFDDLIDAIRTFDPDTQRSLYPVQSVRLLPGREYPMDEASRQAFRKRWREHMPGDPTQSRLYKDMGAGLATAGIEYYLPLFFDETATVFDYIGTQAEVVLHGELEPVFQRFWQDTQDRHRLSQGDPDRPVLPPEHLFLTQEQFYVRLQAHAQLALRPVSPQATDLARERWLSPAHLSLDKNLSDPAQALRGHVQSSPRRTLVVAESMGRRQSLHDLLASHGLDFPTVDGWLPFAQGSERAALTVGPLLAGFEDVELQLTVLTESELFAMAPGSRRRRQQETQSDVASMIRDLSELQLGDPVVHASHGIGRYRGLIHLSVASEGEEEPQEFLHLVYADDASLYVPVSQLHLISRYAGVNPEDAPLHRLGSGQWDKAKRKAAEQVRDTAAELLNVYARRSTREGHAFRYSPKDYEAFSNDFGFEETPDQRAAIHAVVQDMISPRPMDRLVCGDVGFGKTEVALRAAFIAVMGGRQVALLAPTTLLAEQHHQTLVDRFARWPVRIAEMSRFRTPKEIKAAMEGLAQGQIDIVVGTHKLLSPSVSFHNLGLLIIDEEHRFGVRHKEAIKAFRAEVDVLTLTATPIPRTLGMAMEGLRDLSVIATAPQRRLAIKTFVRGEDNGVIREAVLRELKRGGQCYFLHNEVDTIENRRERLQALIPEARIAVAHGQMPERDLERVMRQFVAQKFNVLLCSTIIETGIDVPTANTILIARADKFGLAQLHQLRGRVGRSHHQAYAYLLVPDVQSLTKQAQQRLDAITSMEELGSGFYLAMHDMEIRGVGEVLGEQQSGGIMQVGYQLYHDMLDQAVQALKRGEEPDLLSPLQATTEINLHAPALIPETFCPDVHVRLSFYKRLASAQTARQLDDMSEELIDRFGLLPPATEALLNVHRLRLLAQPLGVLKIDATPGMILIAFKANAPIDALRIIHMVQQSKHIQLAGNDKLRINRALPEVKSRVQAVREVLQHLTAPRATPDAPTPSSSTVH